MKLSLLLAAGLTVFAAPAFAQNFAIPAGDAGYESARAQYNRSNDLVAIAPPTAYHGRSVSITHARKAAPLAE